MEADSVPCPYTEAGHDYRKKAFHVRVSQKTRFALICQLPQDTCFFMMLTHINTSVIKQSKATQPAEMDILMQVWTKDNNFCGSNEPLFFEQDPAVG